MPIPTNKNELITAINETFQKLSGAIQLVPVERAGIKELDGHAKGTKMSVCDLLAYLIGWGQLVLKWHQLHVENKEIDFPETSFQWNELGLLAQKFYRDYDQLSFLELQETLEQTVQQILIILEQTNEQTLYDQPFYKHYPFGRMVQLNTSSPYKNARARIRKWLRDTK